MQGFDDVTLEWGGKSYVIPANRQMMLIAKIEDALSGDSGAQALSVLLRSEGPPYSRLAAAFGTALRYAGAVVTDDEIYLSIMEDFAAQSADVTTKIQNAIFAVLSVIAPPFARSAPTKDATEKKG